jgi:hypothetical protein
MIRTLEYTGISNQNARLKSADIFMYPDMLRFRRTDFHLADQIAQAERLRTGEPAGAP